MRCPTSCSPSGWLRPTVPGTMAAMPSARPSVVEGLEVEEVRDGVTVFDPATGRVHYLNATAAIVFTLCDGTHSASEIARFVAEAFELDEPPIGGIEDCLSMLDRERLLR